MHSRISSAAPKKNSGDDITESDFSGATEGTGEDPQGNRAPSRAVLLVRLSLPDPNLEKREGAPIFAAQVNRDPDALYT